MVSSSTTPSQPTTATRHGARSWCRRPVAAHSTSMPKKQCGESASSCAQDAHAGLSTGAGSAFVGAGAGAAHCGDDADGGDGGDGGDDDAFFWAKSCKPDRTTAPKPTARQ